MAHKLEIPAEAKIHLIFHVSQLKKKLGRTVQVQHQHSSNLIKQNLEPDTMLERRTLNREGRAITKVLIIWKSTGIGSHLGELLVSSKEVSQLWPWVKVDFKGGELIQSHGRWTPLVAPLPMRLASQAVRKRIEYLSANEEEKQLIQLEINGKDQIQQFRRI